MIEIMNLRNTKLEFLYDIKCDRTSPVGNPFPLENESMRDEVCDKYELFFKTMFEHQNPDFLAHIRADFLTEMESLDKILEAIEIYKNNIFK